MMQVLPDVLLVSDGSLSSGDVAEGSSGECGRLLASLAEVGPRGEVRALLEVRVRQGEVALAFIDAPEMEMGFRIVGAKPDRFFKVFERLVVAFELAVKNSEVVVSQTEVRSELDGHFGLIYGLCKHAHLVIGPSEVDKREPGGCVQWGFGELFKDDGCILILLEVHIGDTEIVLAFEHVWLCLERALEVFDGFFVLSSPEAYEAHQVVGFGVFGVGGEHKRELPGRFGCFAILIEIHCHLVIGVDLLFERGLFL